MITDAIRMMLAKGLSTEDALAVAAEFETAPLATARQERNRRYYQARKERLKASEIKTPTEEPIKTFKTTEGVLIQTPNPLDKEGPHTPKENSTPVSPSLRSGLVDEPVDARPPTKKIQRVESDERLLDQITDAWNGWAVNHHCPQVKFLTASRGQHCRQRIRDIANGEEPIVAFRKVLSKCETSFFIRGSPRSRLKFDQLMREGFLMQMLEGAFEYQGPTQWRK